MAQTRDWASRARAERLPAVLGLRQERVVLEVARTGAVAVRRGAGAPAVRAARLLAE